MSFNANSPTFTGNVTVPEPTAGTDAASKAYVDGLGNRTLTGALTFEGEDARPVVLDPALPDLNYTVTATASVPVLCWVTEKQTGGFTVHTSAPISGVVDWVLVQG